MHPLMMALLSLRATIPGGWPPPVSIPPWPLPAAASPCPTVDCGLSNVSGLYDSGVGHDC